MKGLVVLFLMLALAGCSSAPASHGVVHSFPKMSSFIIADAFGSTAMQAADDVAERVSSEQSSQSAPIAPDASIMQSMSCEPLDDGLLEEMDIYFGTPTRAVQVEVGEGMQDGETWWVVVMDSPPDDSYQWGLRAFLTNVPGVEHVDQWVWIPIDLDSDDPWENVSWDTERLVRAQSALTVALEGLDAS